MLRMIIVDDERTIRDALKIFLDWQSLGIEIIGDYKNGAEAFDAMLDDYPDIVLTDIKMPGLNGLELIERAHHAGLNMQFIILSGYAEFEFAKTAMKYGVRHYLLKPISEEQLKAVMLEVRDASLLALAVAAPVQNIEPNGDIIKTIKAYIRQNLSDPSLSLKQISENTLYMNADYVSKIFAKRTGEKFSTYVTRKRLDVARALLATGEYRINQIAEQAGFGSDAQYFCRIFKKATGMTPGEYAKTLKAPQGE